MRHSLLKYARISLVLATIVTVCEAAFSGDPPGVWIEKLASDKPSEFRIAQAYLSRPDSGALPALDSLAQGPDARMRKRLKEVVAMALLNGLEPDELRRYFHLFDICEEEFAKAEKLAETFRRAVEQAARDNPDAREGVQWDHLGEDAVQAKESLFPLHGWAVPALLELANHPEPFLKWQAIHAILVSHGARLPRSAMTRLRNDRTPIVRDHGDYQSPSTIAEELESTIKTKPDSADPNVNLGDCHRCLDLLHQFQGIDWRDRSHYVQVPFEADWSWDQYWSAAQREMERVWDKRYATGAGHCSARCRNAALAKGVLVVKVASLPGCLNLLGCVERMLILSSAGTSGEATWSLSRSAG